MKNEAAFWSDWVKKLLHVPNRRRVAWKVPAELRTGLPDVWFANLYLSGWLELKYEPEWPVRETTPITVKVTSEQLAHLREAAISGQAAFVLLGVSEAWYLLPVRILAPEIKLLRSQLELGAIAWGERGLHDSRLLSALGLVPGD